jgi:periplasmic protein TonB
MSDSLIDRPILICAAVSLLLHFVFSEVIETLPKRSVALPDRRVEVRVVTPPVAKPEPPPPPPEPPKPPEPVKIEPIKPIKTPVYTKPTSKPVQATTHDEVAKDVPASPNAVQATESTDVPVFGVTMESTSTGGKGSVAVGNSLSPQAGTGKPGPVKALAAPVAAYEATKMPLPQGRCAGVYTREAETAAIEGTVILDLIVDESGRARDIKVVTGLEYGLTAAAIKALKDCRFSPGEKNGSPVPVRIRDYKVRFILPGAQ